MKTHWITWTLVATGALNVFVGAAALLAPAWFYAAIGDFAPFNRHYIGDVGGFVLALGVGLLFAARDPARHRPVVGVAALAGGLHTLNHLYDDITAGDWAGHFLSDTIPLLALVILLGVVYWRSGAEKSNP